MSNNQVAEKLLDRETYRAIKAMDKKAMSTFINNIYQQGADSVKSQGIEYDKLKAELSQIKGIGESRLNEIMAVIDKYVCADDEE